MPNFESNQPGKKQEKGRRKKKKEQPQGEKTENAPNENQEIGAVAVVENSNPEKESSETESLEEAAKKSAEEAEKKAEELSEGIKNKPDAQKVDEAKVIATVVEAVKSNPGPSGGGGGAGFWGTVAEKLAGIKNGVKKFFQKLWYLLAYGTTVGVEKLNSKVMELPGGKKKK